MTYKRPQFHRLRSRLEERRKFIQVLSGPRQCGKTTLARQVADSLKIPTHFVSADSPVPYNSSWVEQQWETARFLATKDSRNGTVLILDEIQKVAGWSEVVKKLWDEDTANKRNVKVLILGSAPLLVHHGLTESLSGRFELIQLSHWSYAEMRDAFGWSLEQFIFFGGYPGSADLVDEPERWSHYIQDSLIETTISRDVLLMTRIDKQALLRQLFRVGTAYSGQIVSYQKLLGQLHDAGNTTTLAHYLHILSDAGLLTGLQKYSGSQIRQRSSSPKFLALNNALITAQSQYSFQEAQQKRDVWGRLVESAVGAHLYNSSIGTNVKVMYWREGSREVDFIVQNGMNITAIEVKSGRVNDTIPGMESFTRQYKPKRKLLIGDRGISVKDILLTSAVEW